MSDQATHQRALDILAHRCGRWSRVYLTGERIRMVYDIAWGFDEGEDVAHITSNISPGPSGEHTIDFFRASEVERIEDPEASVVLFDGEAG